MDLQEINNKLDFIIENMTERKEVFDSREASKYLCISYDYLMRLVRDGKIRHKRKSESENASVVFKREWLDDWLEN